MRALLCFRSATWPLKPRCKDQVRRAAVLPSNFQRHLTLFRLFYPLYGVLTLFSSLYPHISSTSTGEEGQKSHQNRKKLTGMLVLIQERPKRANLRRPATKQDRDAQALYASRRCRFTPLLESFPGSFGGYLYACDVLKCVRGFISSIGAYCEVNSDFILFCAKFRDKSFQSQLSSRENQTIFLILKSLFWHSQAFFCSGIRI